MSPDVLREPLLRRPVYVEFEWHCCTHALLQQGALRRHSFPSTASTASFITASAVCPAAATLSPSRSAVSPVAPVSSPVAAVPPAFQSATARCATLLTSDHVSALHSFSKSFFFIENPFATTSPTILLWQSK